MSNNMRYGTLESSHPLSGSRPQGLNSRVRAKPSLRLQRYLGKLGFTSSLGGNANLGLELTPRKNPLWEGETLILCLSKNKLAF